MEIVEQLCGIELRIGFELDPPVGSWRRANDRYEADPYFLVTSCENQDVDIATLNWELARLDGKPVTLNRLRVRCQAPLDGLYRLWPTSGIASDNVYVDLPWKLNSISSTASYDPVLIGMNVDGTNKLTIGLADTAIETRLTGNLGRSSPEAEAGFTSHVYSLQFERPCVDGMSISGPVLADGVFLSRRPESWFDSLGRYATFVDQSRAFDGHPTRERALLPMWHSWYAFENEIDQDRIESQIALVKELGFGTMQLDAGWNTGKHWDEEEGSYEPNPLRFPRFAELIEQIWSVGLVPVAHWSPPWLGANAPNRSRLAHAVQRPGVDRGHKVDFLCPRNPDTIEHIVQSAKYMVETLRFGGLWFDFIDWMDGDSPCDAPHEHIHSTNGQAWSEILSRCAAEVREIDPDCSLIYRRSHANIHNKPYLTHLWPADAPFDFTKNRREVVVMRAYGRGVLTHACCTCWSPTESETTVAQHLASVVLAGVPSISIDLTRFPTSHLEIVRAWLAFYDAHKHDLMLGTLRPLIFMPPSAVIRIESETKAFVGYFETIPGTTPLTKSFDELFLINCANPRIHTLIEGLHGSFSVDVFDHSLRPIDIEIRELTSGPDGLEVALTLPIPVIIQLTRK